MAIIKHLDFELPDFGECPGASPARLAYHHAMLALQPDAYWRLDEVSGVAAINAANPGTYDGVYAPNTGGVWTGGTLGQAGALAGDADKAALFDGSNGYVNCGDVLAMERTDVFSFAFWVRRSDDATNRVVISKMEDYGNFRGWYVGSIGATEGADLTFILRSNIAVEDYIQVTTIGDVFTAAAGWQFWAITYDGSSSSSGITIYLNAVPVAFHVVTGHGSVSGTTISSAPMNIGSRNNGGNLFKGDVDEVAIFKGRALTGAELTHLFNLGRDALGDDALDQPVDVGLPDRAATNRRCLRGAVAPNHAGVSLPVAWSTPETFSHLRLLVNANGLLAGDCSLAVLRDASDLEVCRLTLSASPRRVTLSEPGGLTLEADLADALAWHCVELRADASANVLQLWLNGVSVGTVTPAVAQTTAVYLGPAFRSDDANGSFLLDEVVLTDAYVGPVVVAPTSDFADDPARWLVLYNRNVPDSLAFADAYRQRRGVPYANLLGLDAPTAETIEAADYLDIEQQLNDYLTNNHLAGQIVGLLAGFGVPGYVDVFDNDQQYGLTTRLERPAGLTSYVDNQLYASGLPDARPTVATLAGDLLAARLDAPTLADALALLDRIDQAPALADCDPAVRRLFFDPHTGGDPQSLPWSADGLTWFNSADAQRLRLSLELSPQGETAETSDFSSLVGDAFYFGHAASYANAFASQQPDSCRVACVQTFHDGSVVHSLRRSTASTWPEHALAAGYLATTGIAHAFSPDELPSASRFFEALRRGWTLAEAWRLASPTVRTGGLLIGDPLMTVQFPAGGFDVHGPLQSLQHLAPDAPQFMTPVDVQTFTPDASATPEGEDVVVAVQPRDDRGRPLAMSQPSVFARQAGELAPALTMPHFPASANWLVRESRDTLHLTARFARRLGACRITSAAVEQRVSGVTTPAVEAAVNPLTRSIEAIVARRSDAAAQYRWRFATAQGVVRYTPWSAAVSPLSSASFATTFFGAGS